MDIENQIICIRVNNFNQEHFKNLGYSFNLNDFISIPVKHLPSGSGIKIDVECKYCGKTFKKAYRKYLETKNDLCCNDCRHKKIEKISIQKYGNACSLRNPEVQNKSKEKNMKNLGVQYPFQNKEILEKCRITCINKYGENYRKKVISKQQRYIHSLYGGILNYSEYPYLLDIFFPEELIYFEYDGSGHNLSVKNGECTLEVFLEKEKNRESFLKEKGYKEFRIVSSDDKLPSDEFLLDIKNKAFSILLENGYNKYIYNLNTKTEIFEV